MDTLPVEKQISNPPNPIPLGPAEAEGRHPEPHPSNGDLAGEVPAALFASDEAQKFRSRWENIQIGFVDEPRQSVERADELVAEVINRLAEIFATQRRELEPNLGTGGDLSTEDLRVALRRYRSFSDRLITI
jgi:hypothetical protein